MAKKQHSHIVKAKGSEALAQITDSLRENGYITLTPQVIKDEKPKIPTWEDTISQQLSCSEPGEGSEGRKQAGMLFVSSGTEMPTPDNIGSKGLGYMQWGAGDKLPNIIALFTKMSPYTAAGWEFNTNIVAGLGPYPMYRYSQYVGGNITVKEIPYSTAGKLLKGMRLDILRKLVNLDQPEAASDGSTAGNGSATDFSVGGGSAAANVKEQMRKALQEELAAIDADYKEWERTNVEVNDFMLRNNIFKTFLNLGGDFTLLYNAFAELLLNQQAIDPETGKAVNSTHWKPKVVGIRWRSCFTTRVERMDEENKINFAYLSNRWLDSQYVTTQTVNENEMSAMPMLDEQAPTEDLDRRVREARQKRVNTKDRPTRFMMHLRYPSEGNPYYSVAPWHSVFGGDIYEYAVTMISDRLTRKKNSNVIGRIIYIHNEYLQQIANQRTEEELRKRQAKRSPNTADRSSIFETKNKAVQNEMFAQINEWLSNRDNSGQSLMAYLFRDTNGNMVESFKVVEIESASKNTADANQKELAEISSIIFFAMGLDSRLIGNTPGSEANSSGTDMRERYLLKQLQKSPIQQLLLKPLEVTAQFNKWDPGHLVFRIRREVLTTLDASKTGIAEQNPTE